MKVLFFSDLHAHAFKAYSTILPNGRNSRLEDALNILKQIKEICEEEKIDGVLFGGDLFHIRPGVGSMKIPTFNAVYNAIARLADGLDFLGLLVGNHDQGDRQGKEHSIHVFRSTSVVMDRRTWYQFWAKNECLHVFAIPATDQYDTLESDIKNAIDFHSNAPNEPCIILGHLGLEGAVVGTNFVMHGEGTCDIKHLHAGFFNRVFLGDYHKPQALGENVRYIGATHHHNWGDVKDRRGCLIWDTKSDYLAFRELRAPRFIEYTLQDWDQEDWGIGDFVRIRYDGSLSQKTKNEISEAMLSFGVQSVEFVPNPRQETAAIDEGAAFHPTMDHETMVEAYVETETTDNFDEELLLSLGRQIFSQASERYEK